MNDRVGLGFDVHRLKPGKGLRIGGVDIPCEFAFIAHSDGDVLLHALIDAMLGAAGRGDIGEHFPDTDPKWKDADSRALARAAREIVEETGLAVASVDANVYLERPKLGPRKEEMRRSIAGLLGINVERVNVKAKTMEGLGPLGAGGAAAAQVIVLLVKS